MPESVVLRFPQKKVAWLVQFGEAVKVIPWEKDEPLPEEVFRPVLGDVPQYRVAGA